MKGDFSFLSILFFMKKAVKILIISLVLLIPVLVTIFLNIFGENQYEIPVYHLAGNPLEECRNGGEVHRISEELIGQYSMELPALLTPAQLTDSSPEFENVLSKYPMVDYYSFSQEQRYSGENLILIDSTAFTQLINCELVLGEDEWLDKPIANKSVLIDKERRIRGYFIITDISEIERLDTELDILISYE